MTDMQNILINTDAVQKLIENDLGDTPHAATLAEKIATTLTDARYIRNKDEHYFAEKEGKKIAIFAAEEDGKYKTAIDAAEMNARDLLFILADTCVTIIQSIAAQPETPNAKKIVSIFTKAITAETAD